MSDYLEWTVDKFTFRVASDRLYGADGVWVSMPDSLMRVRLGLSDYVQQRSGDVAFASVQPVGIWVAAGGRLAEVETIKTMVGLLSPVSGTIVEVNPALDTTPEFINQDPYGKGWLAVVETADWEADRAKLMDAAAYLSVMTDEARREP